jgi:hypothetical protein
MATAAKEQTHEAKTWRRFTRFSLGLALLLIAVVGTGLGLYREYGEIIPQTYPTADLLPEAEGPNPNAGMRVPRSTGNAKIRDQMIDEIKTTIQPASWDDRGGRGTIAPFLLNNTLIVKNNRAAHRRIVEWMERKRRERIAIP